MLPQQIYKYIIITKSKITINKMTDLNDLEIEIQEAAYVPSFGKQPKGRSMNKINSNKQILQAPKLMVSLPPSSSLQKPKNNFLQLDKNKSQVKTFQEFFKNHEIDNKVQLKKQTKNELKGIGSLANRQQFNINSILDQQQTFVPSRGRGMKPPISKRNDDGKSITSKFNKNDDENKSITSVNDVKINRGEDKSNSLFGGNQALINTQPLPKPDLHNRQTAKESFTQPTKHHQTFTVDTSELKKMLQQQLQLQKQLNQKILTQQRQNHKNQIAKLKQLHQQQLKTKLELKDFRLQKLKQFYDLQLKVKHQREGQVKELSLASQKIDQGIRAMKQAEQQFKIKTYRYEQEKKAKRNQVKTFQDFTKEKQTYIQQLFNKLQNREKDFKQQKRRFQDQKQRQRKKFQDEQSRIHKKQRQLEQAYIKKQRQLLQDYDLKKQGLQQQTHKLKIQKMQIQSTKHKTNQQRQQLHLRHRKWQQNKNKLLQDLQAQKLKLLSRQIQLDSKYRQWQSKQNQIVLKQKEIIGKFKLIQLQRKKADVHREMKQKVDNGGGKYKFSFQREDGMTPIQKSIKELKDQYLRNLGHI